MNQITIYSNYYILLRLMYLYTEEIDQHAGLPILLLIHYFHLVFIVVRLFLEILGILQVEFLSILSLPTCANMIKFLLPQPPPEVYIAIYIL